MPFEVNEPELTQEQIDILIQNHKLGELGEKLRHMLPVGSGKWCCKKKCNFELEYNYKFQQSTSPYLPPMPFIPYARPGAGPPYGPPNPEDFTEALLIIKQNQKYECRPEPCEFKPYEFHTVIYDFDIERLPGGGEKGYVNYKVTGSGDEKEIARNLPVPCKGMCKDCETSHTCLYEVIEMTTPPGVPNPLGSWDGKTVFDTPNSCPDPNSDHPHQKSGYFSYCDKLENPKPGDVPKWDGGGYLPSLFPFKMNNKYAKQAIVAGKVAELECLQQGKSESDCKYEGTLAMKDWKGSPYANHKTLQGYFVEMVGDICPNQDKRKWSV